VIVPEEQKNPIADEQKNQEALIFEIISKIRASSRFMAVATNQMGKTNAIMFLLRAIMNHPDNINGKWRMKFFDPAFNARYKFDSIPYIDATENARFAYFDANVRVPVPPEVQNIIVDIPYTNTSNKKRVIMEVLKADFEYKRELKKVYKGDVPYQDFYIVDEMQNVWGNYALRGNVGEEALTIFSESSNYKMAIMGISQRFADVATGIVERCRYYFVGGLSGANEITRLAKMVNNSQKIIDKVKTLKLGEFIFIDRSNTEYFDTLEFEKFVGRGEPYQYVAPIQEKVKSPTGFKAFRTYF
jgi:hypothetical protein